MRLVPYQLRHLDTGAVVRNYEKEGAALAFLRDVIRVGSRDAGSRFVLLHEDEHGGIRTIAQGEALMRRALEDQAEA
jgi:hypothetical protein